MKSQVVVIRFVRRRPVAAGQAVAWSEVDLESWSAAGECIQCGQQAAGYPA
jgi:hypothetical protein